MRAVKAEVTSSEPISLGKAARVLSHFTASETGARPDVAAYLKRAAASFDELVSIHREIRHQQKNSLQELLKEENYGIHQQMTESDRIVANNEGMKREEKKEKKRKAKRSGDEMKGEVESDGKRSVQRAHQENKQEGRMVRDKKMQEKKRKHLGLSQGGRNDELEQHEGKRKSKWRKVE